MSRSDLVIILASGSPQRKRLLAEAGYAVEVVVPGDHAESGAPAHEGVRELVMRFAYQKSLDVASRIKKQTNESRKQAVLVACDTLAECRGEILGKPRDAKDARRMLELLSGEEHQVYSGLCVWPLAMAEPRTRLARTTLFMDQLGKAEIDEYLASDQWREKAGAFGYQDRPGWLHIVEGSPSNVIGLPLELLEEMLNGMEPWAART
jgi:septum formation protein